MSIAATISLDCSLNDFEVFTSRTGIAGFGDLYSSTLLIISFLTSMSIVPIVSLFYLLYHFYSFYSSYSYKSSSLYRLQALFIKFLVVPSASCMLECHLDVILTLLKLGPLYVTVGVYYLVYNSTLFTSEHAVGLIISMSLQ